jgi:oligoendopeptidase F
MNKPAKKLPYKTEWDFKIFYKNAKDPQIEKDVQAAEAAYKKFADTWKHDDSYVANAGRLLAALRDYEKLHVDATNKPLMYFNYIRAINSLDSYAEAMFNKLIARYTNAGNQVIFFTLKLGKIDKEKQEEILSAVSLRSYHYFLKQIFETSKYDLSEAEEKILNITSQTSRSMWVDGFEKLLSKQTVKFKGKDIPLPEAMGRISSLPKKDRHVLHADVMKKIRSVSDFAEAEINAVYTDKKNRDELRGLKEPYDATVLGYQNDPAVVKNLVNVVTKKFNISQRFYKLKAKILKEKHLSYADRSVTAGVIKRPFDYPKAKEFVSDVFGKVDTKYKDMFDSFCKHGQIDVFPKKGKTGGAFCSHNYHTPTMVMLNHTDDIRAVTTLAHEMGHAFHSELSKSQPILYQDYTISVAEVASTLFENFVFEELFETLSPSEQIVALHNQINDDIATVFRQIACFNFEYELHQKIRQEGMVVKEDIARLMNKHVAAYIGPAMKLTEDDGYFFAHWSHIRNFFYVYSYAFGQLISKALYAEYKKDKKFLVKIEQFLSAGGSDSPENIFKKIGIDVSDPAFFEAGLKTIEEDIKKLENLTKK